MSSTNADTVSALRASLAEALTGAAPTLRSLLHRAERAIGALAERCDDLERQVSGEKPPAPAARSREFLERANGAWQWTKQFPEDSFLGSLAMIQFAVYLVGAGALEQLEALNHKLEGFQEDMEHFTDRSRCS